MPEPFAKEVVVDGVRGRGQHLPFGILAGVLAAAAGAVLWMAVTLATGLHVGYVALAVGALVGLAVRYFGNGTGMVFGIVGAVLTLAGCLGGEILTVAQSASSAQHDFYSTLTTLDLVQTVTTIFNQMGPMTYLIYGIGIFEGYKLSIRK